MVNDRPQIEDDHAADDQRDAERPGGAGRLAEEGNADLGDHRRAKPSPNGVGHGEIHQLQGLAEGSEGDHISNNGDC